MVLGVCLPQKPAVLLTSQMRGEVYRFTAQTAFEFMLFTFLGRSQVLQNQDEVGQKDETEPADSTVGQNEDWKHHQVII